MIAEAWVWIQSNLLAAVGGLVGALLLASTSWHNWRLRVYLRRIERNTRRDA